MPVLTHWRATDDHDPCPLRQTYQLVRNILAACVRPGAGADPALGHAVLVYDARNPEFGPGGAAREAWDAVKAALRYPRLLQRCSWQEVIECLRGDHDLAWLVRALSQKYGL